MAKYAQLIIAIVIIARENSLGQRNPRFSTREQPQVSSLFLHTSLIDVELRAVAPAAVREYLNLKSRTAPTPRIQYAKRLMQHARPKPNAPDLPCKSPTTLSALHDDILTFIVSSSHVVPTMHLPNPELMGYLYWSVPHTARRFDRGPFVSRIFWLSSQLVSSVLGDTYLSFVIQSLVGVDGFLRKMLACTHEWGGGLPVYVLGHGRQVKSSGS